MQTFTAEGRKIVKNVDRKICENTAVKMGRIMT